MVHAGWLSKMLASHRDHIDCLRIAPPVYVSGEMTGWDGLSDNAGRIAGSQVFSPNRACFG